MAWNKYVGRSVIWVGYKWSRHWSSRGWTESKGTAILSGLTIKAGTGLGWSESSQTGISVLLTKPCTRHCRSFMDSEIDAMGRADCWMWPGRAYSKFPSSSAIKSPWQRHLKRTWVERLSNYLKHCPSSFSLSPECLILLSTLNSFQGVLKVSSCRNMWFNPYRGKWQVPLEVPIYSW